MLQFIQANLGSIAALLVVAFFVFLAIRRMVLDKKAGIGACGQKCSECSKMGQCADAVNVRGAGTDCSGECASCKYKASCHR